MRSLIQTTRRLFCDLHLKNRRFIKKTNKYEQDLFIHEKASKIDDKRIADFITETPREKIAYDLAKKTDYDTELKDFIEKFNIKHKNRITLMDFSSYTTEFGELKDKPIRKEDIELVKEFQKRKVDQRVTEMRDRIRNKMGPTNMDPDSMDEYVEGWGADKEKHKLNLSSSVATASDKKESTLFTGPFLDEREVENVKEVYRQGPFEIKDSFIIVLLNVKLNTKVTTLNRINSYKTLLFMGNGNGIISYAKGKGANPAESLDRAIYLLKKNLIAIPRDSRCTMPLPIKKRFQDYRIYLRPNVGFNAHGHPLIAFMLGFAGIEHCGFHVSHTEKNIYNILKVFYKAVTTNTTPQELAEREGFKIYRHQFIRPLTYKVTHGPITIKQAKIRQYRRFNNIKKPGSVFYNGRK